MPEKWSQFEPRGADWNVALAGHLLRRTTFGFTSAQLKQVLAEGPRMSIDRLLARPAEYAAFEQSVAALIPAEAGSQDSGEVWLYRMQHTPYPFLEKATLFWHNFFGVAGSRVALPSLMERHLQLLRKHALGHFDVMLSEVAHDPAALLANGPPALVNRDAFSGVTVLRGEYHFDAARHRGSLTPDDAVREALSQPATSQTVVRRVCRWLLGNVEVAPSLLTSLADGFSRDYDIGKLVYSLPLELLLLPRGLPARHQEPRRIRAQSLHRAADTTRTGTTSQSTRNAGDAAAQPAFARRLAGRKTVAQHVHHRRPQ